MTDFWTTAISVCLGFLSALAVESITKRASDSDDRNRLLAAFKSELASIKSTLEEMDRDSVFPRPLSTPVWSGAVFAGKLSLLSESADYNELVKLYSRIEIENEWEARNFESTLQNPESTQSVALARFVEDRRADLIKEISPLLNKWASE